MGLGEKFLNRIGYYKTPQETPWLDKEGKPKSIIAARGGVGGGLQKSQRDEKTLKSYQEYYENEGIVFSSITTTAYNTVMTGYSLTSESENVEAKKFIYEYLDGISLELTMLDAVKQALIFGDAFIEIVKAGDVITSLKLVNPIQMSVDTDEHGVVKGYIQSTGMGGKSIKFKPEEIMHVRFFPQTTSPYGISIIGPNLTNISRKINVDSSIYNAILRHTAKYLVKVGTPEILPPKSAFDDIKTSLEDINSKKEIITTGLVDITTIDERGVQNIDKYFDTFMMQVITGMLIPGEALGLGERSTEASSRVRQVMYERLIRSFQLRLAKQINSDLINPILEKNGHELNTVKIKFKGTTTSDEEGISKWMGNLFRGFQFAKQKPLTINEIRAKLDLEPIEGGDDITWGGGGEPLGANIQPTVDREE